MRTKGALHGYEARLAPAAYLSARIADAYETPHVEGQREGPSDVHREQRGLVVSAFDATRAMEGHGEHTIDLSHVIEAAFGGMTAENVRVLRAASVFEAVDGVGHRSAMEVHAHTSVDTFEIRTARVAKLRSAKDEFVATGTSTGSDDVE